MSAIFFNQAISVRSLEPISFDNLNPVRPIYEDITYTKPIYDLNQIEPLYPIKPINPVNDYQPYPGNNTDPLYPKPPPEDYTEDVSEYGTYGGYTHIPGTFEPPVIEPDQAAIAGVDPKMIMIGAGALLVGFLLYKIL